MEWYIIGGLIILVLVILFVKNRNVAVKMLTGQIMTLLRNQEAYLVQGIYSVLPPQIKAVVTSYYLAEIVSYAIFFIGRMLKESDKKDVPHATEISN